MLTTNIHMLFGGGGFLLWGEKMWKISKQRHLSLFGGEIQNLGPEKKHWLRGHPNQEICLSLHLSSITQCVLYTRCRSVNCTLFTRVCFRHCSEYCAHQVFTPNTVCNAFITFNYACMWYNQWEGMHILRIYSLMQMMKAFSLSSLLCSVCSDMQEWRGRLEIAKKESTIVSI